MDIDLHIAAWFNRAPADGYKLQTLSYRHIYILPTLQGIAFGIMLVVITAGSANYNNSLGYMLAFLLASLSIVSILYTFRNISGLKVRCGHVEPVFAGEPILLPLNIDNTQGLARYTLVLTHDTRRQKSETASLVVVETGVPADSIKTIQMPIETHQRGRLQLKRLSLASQFPLGLFRTWSPLHLAINALVFPKPEGGQELPENEIQNHETGESSVSGQDDFDGFREYVPGDSPKRIYWKAEAREQGLMLKQFHGGSQGDVLLRLQDVSASDTEAALSQLCEWILLAGERGLRYGLQLPGVNIPVDDSADHMQNCLEALALYENAT